MKWQVKHFDSVLSTNETAKQFPIFTAVIANTQTGGKGRMGRVWESPKGNLYLSIVVPDEGAKTPLLSFVTALSVAQALPDFPIRLKWPNDVFLNGGKLAGILLEHSNDKVIIGIGVNTTSCPTQNMLYPTTCLDGKITPTDLSKRILEQLSITLDLFHTHGFGAIRTLWLQWAMGLNQPISVHLPHTTLNGIFKGISPQGELLLETPDKAIQTITAGDVFFNVGFNND